MRDPMYEAREPWCARAQCSVGMGVWCVMEAGSAVGEWGRRIRADTDFLSYLSYGAGILHELQVA
jgi:hypothetical protein